MSVKLKVLALGLIAVVATGAITVVNAGAITGGHFVSDTATTTITGSEGGNHVLEFLEQGATTPESKIFCTETSYTGTASAITTTELKITPSWNKCHTTGLVQNFDVDENGCTFVFTVRPNGHENHNTVHLNCPQGKVIEITHPNCNITVPPQTLEGVTYTREVDPTTNKHVITLDSTVKNIQSQYHEKVCVFLGTNHISEMTGSVTVKGTSGGVGVNITAT